MRAIIQVSNCPHAPWLLLLVCLHVTMSCHRAVFPQLSALCFHSVGHKCNNMGPLFILYSKENTTFSQTQSAFLVAGCSNGPVRPELCTTDQDFILLKGINEHSRR